MEGRGEGLEKMTSSRGEGLPKMTVDDGGGGGGLKSAKIG